MAFRHFTKGSPEARAWGEKMRALRKERGTKRGPAKRAKRNAKGDYTGVLKLPFYIDRAVAFVLHDGPRVLDWEWDRRMSPENKKHFHDFLVSVHHPLAYEAGTPEQRFKRFIMEYVMPRIEKNPGEGYHVKEAGEAHKIVRQTDDPDEKIFYAGVESAHRISASSARRLGMNCPKTRTISRSLTRRVPPQRRRGARSNPLAVFGVGNPPKRLNTGIAGVVYSRCLEIRAEKLKYKPGLYRHPFSKSSGVQVLALDNGDMLVHSTRGVNLWKPI